MIERDFSEHFIQRSAFSVYDHRRMPGAVMFAIPNGGARNPVTGKILKREGVKAGAPDLFACANGKPFLIELKKRDGVVSAVQDEFHNELIAAGVDVVVCYGLDDILDTLADRGIIREPAKRKAVQDGSKA